MKQNKTCLGRKFYGQPAEVVARELLGARLHFRDQVGKIVETEAYVGEEDLAAHSSKGRTGRTEVLFGPPGFAYVYFIYGLFWMLNVSTGPEGRGEGVLIRALEPVRGIEGATNGPARLTRTLGITGAQKGIDLTVSDELFIDARSKEPAVVVAPRIGVGYAKEWAAKPLRFYIADNPYVSIRLSSHANKNRTCE